MLGKGLIKSEVIFRQLFSNNHPPVVYAQRTLYAAQQTLIADKYNYIMSLLKLKQAVGKLSVADLQYIKAWLQ